MKILIFLLYYNRPKLLRKCLQSLINANCYYQNWELIFGDDNSPIPGQQIVEEVLSKDLLKKVKFLKSNMSFEDKIKEGISLGKHANLCLQESNADIAITLCDDDQLVPEYLRNISHFFETNTQQVWGYSHLAIFNPLYQNSSQVDLTNLKECTYNQNKKPINPAGILDSSQVAYRISIIDDEIKYPDTSKLNEGMPWLINPDQYLFTKIYEKFGLCPFTGLVAQYKGIHEHQLVWHKKQGVVGLKEYIDKVHELGGKIF